MSRAMHLLSGWIGVSSNLMEHLVTVDFAGSPGWPGTAPHRPLNAVASRKPVT